MPHLKTNSAEVYYQTWLTSDLAQPWIYLVNGHTRSHKDFQFMAKYLNEKNLNVVSLDNRGSGDTKVYQGVSLDLLSEDLFALIRHTHNAQAPLFVLGISMGGGIAQNLAIYNNDLIDKLILVSTCSRAHPWMMKPEGPWPTELDKIVTRLEVYFSPSFRAKNAMLIKAMAKNILQLTETGRFREKAAEQVAAMKGFDLSDKIGEIKAKTLIIHGDADEIIDIEAAYFAADHIHDATLKIYPGAGHLLIAEMGKTLYQDVAEFILLQ